MNSQVRFASVRLGPYLTILQKTTRVCTLARKNVKSHVVDGWAMIMCKECHSGKCFTHILEAGIHSSEALLTVELDKTHGKWHSIHTNRQKHYDDAVPPLISAARQGDKTEIDRRLVYFARTFQTPRPLSKWVSLGFYDKELPDPEEVSCHPIHAGFTLTGCLAGPTRPYLSNKLQARNPRNYRGAPGPVSSPLGPPRCTCHNRNLAEAETLVTIIKFTTGT